MLNFDLLNASKRSKLKIQEAAMPLPLSTSSRVNSRFAMAWRTSTYLNRTRWNAPEDVSTKRSMNFKSFYHQNCLKVPADGITLCTATTHRSTKALLPTTMEAITPTPQSPPAAKPIIARAFQTPKSWAIITSRTTRTTSWMPWSIRDRSTRGERNFRRFFAKFRTFESLDSTFMKTSMSIRAAFTTMRVGKT